MKLMRKLFYLTLLLVVFISCDKNDDLNFGDVTGIYEGTLSTNVAAKSDTKSTANGNFATVKITMVGDQIQVYCYNDIFEATVMLDLFRDNEDVKVCLTGSDFENMYGHMAGDRGMNGGMMGDGNQWMQHLSDEHTQGDLHYGGFDMSRDSFEYTFNVNGNEFYFEGIKQ